MTARERVIVWAVVILVVSLLGGGGVTVAWVRAEWARHAGVRRQLREGAHFGTTATWHECIEEGLQRRARARGEPPLQALEKHRFLEACLMNSKTPPQCADVPPLSDLDAGAAWSHDLCADGGVQVPERCEHLFELRFECQRRKDSSWQPPSRNP